MIEARFIGMNGSAGLKHGKKYQIEIKDNTNKLIFRGRYDFYVYVNGTFGIPYDTMKAIKKNWEFPIQENNACCFEQKLLIDGGQFADMPTMQSAT